MTGQGPLYWLLVVICSGIVVGLTLGLVQAAWVAWLDAADRRDANRRNRARRREAAMTRHPAGRTVLHRAHHEAIEDMDSDRRWNRGR